MKSAGSDKSSRCVLVTGANRGLGLEFTRKYLQRGWRVYASARDPKKADELNHLVEGRSERLHVLPLDVRSEDAIRAAARTVATSTNALDLLINNAGVYLRESERLGHLNFDDAGDVLRTNAIAPLIITQALLSLLKRGRDVKVVAITSGYGFVSANTGDFPYYYSASKAALNMYMRSLAGDLRQFGITVAVLNPGWVSTDMGGPHAPVSPQQSVTGMTRVIDALTIDQTGLAFNWRGETQAWGELSRCSS